MRTSRFHSIFAALAISAGSILAARQGLENIPASPEPCYPPAPKQAPVLDVARYLRLADKEVVQVPCHRLMDGEGRMIELTGVIHVADPAYFETINQHLKDFDAVLFELVGDAADVEAARKKQPTARGASPMAKIYTFMAHEVLGMVVQGEVIDYANPNFIHADLSETEINDLLKPHNLTVDELLTGRLKGAQMDLNQMVEVLPMIKATLPKDDPHALKRMVAPSITRLEGGGCDMDRGEGSVFHDIVVVKRNTRALEVLQRELAAGKKKISILYGSAHMPDFKQRLLDKGWQESGIDWRDAWTIPALNPPSAASDPSVGQTKEAPPATAAEATGP